MLVDNEYGVHLHSGQGPDAMSTGSLLNDTIAMNRDVGLKMDDLVLGTLARVINCIVYFNNAGNDQSSPTLASLTSVDIEYCNWQGMWPLPNNNIASDPYFVDEDSGDYHLTSSSPCIDAGDDTPSTLDIGEVDFEGDDRQINAVAGGLVVDIGADEYMPEE